MTAPGGGLARRLASNTLHAASGRVAGLLLWLLLTPPLYHALGPEGFGVWSLFYALTGWLTALDFGLSGATLRHVAAARARGDAGSAGAFASVSMIGYAALGLVWLALVPVLRGPALDFLRVAGDVRPAADFAFVMGALVFALTGFGTTTAATLQAYERFDLANAVTLTATLTQAAGLGACLAFGWGLPGVVTAAAAGWVVAAFVGLLLLRRGAPGFAWGTPAAAAGKLRESLAFGAPLQLANMLAVAHQQLDKVLLARFVALGAVAPYELGLRMATSAATFPQLLMMALVPAAAAFHAGGERARLAELHSRSNRWVLFATVTVTAGVVAGAPRLLGAWLGHDDAPAALALRGLMLAACAGLAAGMASVTARGVGRTDLEAEFSAVAFTVHLALGLWLVPARGLEGALIAVIAGNALGAAWFLARLARTLGWPFAATVLVPLALPLLALAAGAALGVALDRLLPAVTGAAAWGATLVVGGGAALACAALALALRYVRWSELRRLTGARTP
ncbi:MAG: oligosaccharide flippase family protein [Candidatus Eisenbacteria bacterium]